MVEERDKGMWHGNATWDRDMRVWHESVTGERDGGSVTWQRDEGA